MITSERPAQTLRSRPSSTGGPSKRLQIPFHSSFGIFVIDG